MTPTDPASAAPDLATARPWEAMTTGSEGCSIVAVGVRLPRVARLTSGPFETCKADAALIVEAVNSYDRLRAIETAALAFVAAEKAWTDARLDPALGSVADEAAAALRAALEGSKP